MKKVAISFFFVLGTGLIATAQEQEPQQVKRIQLVKIEKDQKSNGLTKEQELENLNYQLEALDNKEALIRQDPEETRIATEQGWFEKTNATRARIRARINELQK